MEIQIYTPTQAQPLPPVEWNYEEIKAWLSVSLAKYEGLVYDECRMNDAKKDRAQLNKVAQAIDGKRKEMRQLYLAPYDSFEAQAKELVNMVKLQSGKIDAQVKAYEAQKKEEKRQMIEAELYAPMIGNLAELVPYNRLHEARWLNVTCSVATISEELGRKIDGIVHGLDSIKMMNLDPEMMAHATDVFLNGFDLAAAVTDTERVRKQRESLKNYDSPKTPQDYAGATFAQGSVNTPPQKEKPHTEPQGTKSDILVVDFRVRLTREKLKALGDFMRDNDIKPERI